MASFAFDYSAISEPNLLVPRKKPIGNVQINWADPITDGLTACFLFQQNNPLRNHVEHMPDMTNATGASFEHVKGNLRLLDTENYDFRLSNAVIDNSTNFDTIWTIFVRSDIRKSAVANNDQIIFIANPNSDTGDVPLYFDNVGTNGRLTAYNGGKIAITSPEPNFNPNIYESYCGIRNTTQDYSIYINGGTLTGGAQTFNTNYGFFDILENDAIHFFPDGNVISKRILIDVECIYVFNRALFDIEVASLHNNTYRFLNPA